MAFRDINSEASAVSFDDSQWATVGTTSVSNGYIDGNIILSDDKGTGAWSFNNVPYVDYDDSGSISAKEYSAGNWNLVGNAQFAQGSDPALTVIGECLI